MLHMKYFGISVLIILVLLSYIVNGTPVLTDDKGFGFEDEQTASESEFQKGTLQDPELSNYLNNPNNPLPNPLKKELGIQYADAIIKSGRFSELYPANAEDPTVKEKIKEIFNSQGGATKNRQDYLSFIEGEQNTKISGVKDQTKSDTSTGHI